MKSCLGKYHVRNRSSESLYISLGTSSCKIDIWLGYNGIKDNNDLHKIEKSFHAFMAESQMTEGSMLFLGDVVKIMKEESTHGAY